MAFSRRPRRPAADDPEGEGPRPLTYEQALGQLAHYCAGAERSPAQVRTRLARTGLPEGEQERVYEMLINEGYLDPARYSRALVGDKLKLNGWGGRRLAQRLRQGGIDEETAAVALGAVSEEDYRERLTPLLARKLAQLDPALPAYDRMARLVRFGMGRGFTFTQIKAVAGPMLKAAGQPGNDELADLEGHDAAP